MKIKEKVDINAKKLDIVKSKAIGFMAISGASWVWKNLATLQGL